MTIDRMHHEIKARLNKINSNSKKDLPAAFIDDAINKAQDDYVEIFYSGNNSKAYKFGFEVTQQRIDMLSNLVVKDRDITFALDTTNVYQGDIEILSPKYRHIVSGYLVQDGCRSPLTIIRHNDLEVKLADANTKPSKVWKRALGIFAFGQLYVYTDGILSSLKISFIKEPRKVFYGGYNSLEFISGDTTAYNTATSKVSSEVNEAFHDLLVDMTVQYLAAQLEDTTKFQLTRDQILSKI